MRSILVLNLMIKKIFYDNLLRGQNINIEVLKIFACNVYEHIRHIMLSGFDIPNDVH